MLWICVWNALSFQGHWVRVGLIKFGCYSVLVYRCCLFISYSCGFLVVENLRCLWVFQFTVSVLGSWHRLEILSSFGFAYSNTLKVYLLSRCPRVFIPPEILFVFWVAHPWELVFVFFIIWMKLHHLLLYGWSNIVLEWLLRCSRYEGDGLWFNHVRLHIWLDPDTDLIWLPIHAVYFLRYHLFNGWLIINIAR